jgi:hypothetical protein
VEIVAFVQRLRISDLELQIEIAKERARAWRETEKKEEPDEKS